jgi:zinc transporter
MTPSQSDHEPLADLGRTVLQPGLIWACRSVDGRTEMVDGGDPPGDCAFRWLHFNLADQRSLSWLERSIALPPAVLRLFTTQEKEQRGLAEDGYAGLVLHDFERDFDWDDTGRIGALHIVVGPGLILTGRFHPLHSADVIRRRIAGGLVLEDAPTALALLLDALADTLEERVLKVTQELLAAEDDLLSDGASPDTRELITLRRLCTQLHRTAVGMRATLMRMESEQGVPSELQPLFRRTGQRLQTIDHDIGGAQSQLRLLRDELDLQAAQRANRNLYFLSIMTALLMPATLVTGFFGMNTGALPFAQGPMGTVAAGGLMLASSVITYFALRMMGFVRQ